MYIYYYFGGVLYPIHELNELPPINICLYMLHKYTIHIGLMSQLNRNNTYFRESRSFCIHKYIISLLNNIPSKNCFTPTRKKLVSCRFKYYI